MIWNETTTLSYTVDLSAVGCACNAALYLVAMVSGARPALYSCADIAVGHPRSPVCCLSHGP
jgi:hypothetical protein